MALKALQNRWTILHHNLDQKDLRGKTSETWLCVDCGVNTAPGIQTRKEAELALLLKGHVEFEVDSNSEVYRVKPEVWKLTGLEDWGGCLCIGCLEKRIGRRLKPKDFDPDHPFSAVPGTPRLLKRRGRT